MKDEKLNGIPRQSSAQRFPYFQNGAATLKGREAPGTRLRFFGVLIHAHGANHIILNLTNRFGEKRKGERAVTPRELWRLDPCISLRPKFSLLQFLIPFWLHFKATLISTWNENMANKNPFFRLSKVNDSWKKQVFGETHYWNLEWIKEEITLSNG